ncbi:TonB-dependent receptor [Saccharobesus litoralis]|uniref:TonB-dependent receptor n=1 Tax=Saccharobesus litoralis TaxID=2172099 RepID=A0A2S0VUL5_9ALTE|nr:TonB-dependent receptor plug domain-containing protein [Saccharobesus litoralis]AWB67914.1 TonB-dependent receptor [Saccharobesus litoralis]
MKNQHKFNKIALAVGFSLLGSVPAVMAADEDAMMEEVVATGSRLQGSAAAVIEERKSQAFVADILGAEQLSRTGDSDAASALRRVTGLTLVDGKFIYVRGLGERYSSARLNGAHIPSPDLTRNVIPLDIIPSSIIESLSVQKAFSPSMPAAFGGGSIDIRTKTVPSEFTAGLEIGTSIDSSADEGYTYDRPSGGVPAELAEAIVKYKGDFSLRSLIQGNNLQAKGGVSKSDQAIALNNELLTSMPRNYDMEQESLDPALKGKFHIGNSFEEDFFGGNIGVLASVSYDRVWDASKQRTGVIAADVDADCSESLSTSEDATNSCFNTVKDSTVTTQTERYNGVLNLGYEVDSHKISWANLYLADNEDETDVVIAQSPAGSNVFTIANEDRARRIHEFNYEKRTLKINQLIGQHTFLDLNGLGLDWQYTRSKAETEIPTNAKFEFEENYTDGVYKNTGITGDDNRATFNYTDMQDNVDSYGFNLTYPMYIGEFEVEFKAGTDATDRGRIYTTSSFVINNDTNIPLQLNANEADVLNVASYLTEDFVNGNEILVDFNEPTSPDADDYLAAQKIVASYGSFDVLYKGAWRISGGLRYEQFRQTSIGTSSLIFTADDLETFYSDQKIQDGSINSDDLYPALSFTYIGGNDYQVRLGYGETVVRPDLREVVPVSYYDPLTDIRTFGRVGLQSSNLKNFDLRYENYSDNGDNFTIAAFYKDIQAPIETVLRVGDEDYSATFVNGEDAQVYGVEVEWLNDLSGLISGTFFSGNVTLSESEVTINPAFAGNLTNPTKQMSGHSEYVANMQLGYDSDDGNHTASLVYNVFGERILASGVGGREDAFEQPFHSLDMVYSYYPDFSTTVKVKVKNLLDSDVEVTQSDVVVRRKEVGIGFGVDFKYEF